MLEAIRTLFVFSLAVALFIAGLLYIEAAPVSRLFIDNSETVAFRMADSFASSVRQP